MRTPSKTTLKKYGLSLEEWTDLYNKYDGKCWICGTWFDGRDRGDKPRLACIDHQHVKGFKDMPDEEKAKHIRGMLCFQCNNIMAQKSNTLEKLRNAVVYLEEYEKTNFI